MQLTQVKRDRLDTESICRYPLAEMAGPVFSFYYHEMSTALEQLIGGYLRATSMDFVEGEPATFTVRPQLPVGLNDRSGSPANFLYSLQSIDWTSGHYARYAAEVQRALGRLPQFERSISAMIGNSKNWDHMYMMCEHLMTFGGAFVWLYGSPTSCEGLIEITAADDVERQFVGPAEFVDPFDFVIK